jgi:hypothetical protein
VPIHLILDCWLTCPLPPWHAAGLSSLASMEVGLELRSVLAARMLFMATHVRAGFRGNGRAQGTGAYTRLCASWRARRIPVLGHAFLASPFLMATVQDAGEDYAGFLVKLDALVELRWLDPVSVLRCEC